jgi:glucosamine--fructose-6-phosphate aminotransferase (isomerizing)
MCGIVGYVGSKRSFPSSLRVCAAWNTADTTQRDSSGRRDARRVGVFRAEGKLHNLEKVLSAQSPGNVRDRTYALGDPRTSDRAESHPHRDFWRNIVVVHNGIVENILI